MSARVNYRGLTDVKMTVVQKVIDFLAAQPASVDLEVNIIGEVHIDPSQQVCPGVSVLLNRGMVLTITAEPK